jgi:hypothetical protein
MTSRVEERREKMISKYERLLKNRHWPESNTAARRAIRELLREFTAVQDGR